MKFLFRLLRQFSIRALVLLGIVATLFPFLAGFLSAIDAVNELTELSRDFIKNQSVESASFLRLKDDLDEFEKLGLTYWKNPDKSSVNEVNLVFNKVQRFIKEESPKSWRESEEIETVIGQLSLEINRALDYLNKVPHKSEVNKTKALNHQEDSKPVFLPIHDQLKTLSEIIEQNSKIQLSRIDLISQSVKQKLVKDILILLLSSFTLLSLFLYLLHNPIKQIDHVIRALGSGNFSQSIKLNGPGDIEFLGERLEWLRVRLNDLELGKQRFVRNVSHEIKTPLASIHEGSDLLLDEIVGELNREQKEIAQIMASNADKLDKLIAELINYSQVSVRRDQVKFAPVNMKMLILSTIEDHQLQIRNKSIQLIGAYDSISVMGVQEQLKTIVDNLLSNAIKYSPSSGEIRISLRKDGGHMVMEVEDEGPGIDPDEQTRIFEPFYQGRASRVLGVKGTGFGLAIVAECVTNHHGKVEATHSKDDEGGACFRVRLPLQPSI